MVEKMRQHNSISELEKILDETRNFFDQNKHDIFKIEKLNFDKSIANGKFAQTIQNKKKIENSIINMNQKSNELDMLTNDINA